MGHKRLGQDGAVLQLIPRTGQHTLPPGHGQVRRLAGVHGVNALLEGVNVVVGKLEGFNLGQLRLVGEGRQDGPQLLKRLVQGLHSCPFPVVCLGPPHLFDPAQLSRGPMLHLVLGAPPDRATVELPAKSGIITIHEKYVGSINNRISNLKQFIRYLLIWNRIYLI